MPEAMSNLPDGGPSRTLSIALVGWCGDKDSVRYLCALEGLALTMRHDARPRDAVKIEKRLGSNPSDMSNYLREPADVLVYSGHAGIDESGPFISGGGQWIYLSEIRQAGSNGVSAAGIVLDCCQGGDKVFHEALRDCLDRDTVVLSCQTRAPYTHGPVLLPILFAQLACPNTPPRADLDTLANIMRRTCTAAENVWDGDWERWVVARIGRQTE